MGKVYLYPFTIESIDTIFYTPVIDDAEIYGKTFSTEKYDTLNLLLAKMDELFGEYWGIGVMPYGNISGDVMENIHKSIFPQDVSYTQDSVQITNILDGKRIYNSVGADIGEIGVNGTYISNVVMTNLYTASAYSKWWAAPFGGYAGGGASKWDISRTLIIGNGQLVQDMTITDIVNNGYMQLFTLHYRNSYYYASFTGRLGTSGQTQYLDKRLEILNDSTTTPKYIKNADPYADGGASDTGGGGGSFDGTTEIINEPDTPLVNVSATKFVSLYNPTESQLNNLAYFMWHTLDPTTWIKIVADPMDAIISLSVLPIAIPSSSASDISVGGISTGVSCNLASAQYISFDAGTITVPQYSNSYLDYAPYTTISIYLPYVGLRKIPTDLVMGKVLGVKYRIDIFTGACCVYITVGGSVILQFTGNCAQQIPFTSSNWTQAITTMISMIGSGVMAVANPATAALSVAGMANSAVNGLHADIETGGANGGNVGFLGVQKPYIIIQRPKQCIPANQNTFTGYPSYITATFGDLKGYTEVDKIILENINATENELNELESLLKGGVYVNEL